MRLHTDVLTYGDICAALNAAKDAGKVKRDVYFEILTYGSRSRARAFEVQLMSDSNFLAPGKNRHAKNSGIGGADGQVWAATYDEWGFFIAELFARDPNAIFGPYKSADNFHAQTHDDYATVGQS